MPAPEVQLKFEGGDADRHTVDMKYYALALQGMEELLSDGLILLSQQRLPKPRERAPILVKAREAKAGSHLTPTDLSEAYQLFQFGMPIIADIGSEFLYNWVKAVIAHFSGKESDMQIALDRMNELNRAHLAARDRSDERIHAERAMAHEERMLTLETLRTALQMQGRAAERLVAPVGPSVERAELMASPGRSVEMDLPTAEAIRDHNKVIWEKISPLNLETDGFKFHTSGLSVRNPEGESFMMATVKDPAFSDEENAYTEAAQRRATISVLARKGRRNGVLAKLEILEFLTVIEDRGPREEPSNTRA